MTNDERGTTLVELVITMSLLVIVGTVLVASFLSMQRTEAYVADRARTLDEMRITMNRLTREVRQGEAFVGAPTSAGFRVRTYVDGQAHEVAYVASAGTLTRAVDAEAPVVVQRDLASTDVFGYAPDDASPEVVTVTLRVRPANAPDTTVTLESEVRLRNLTEAS